MVQDLSFISLFSVIYYGIETCHSLGLVCCLSFLLLTSSHFLILLKHRYMSGTPKSFCLLGGLQLQRLESFPSQSSTSTQQYLGYRVPQVFLFLFLSLHLFSLGNCHPFPCLQLMTPTTVSSVPRFFLNSRPISWLQKKNITGAPSASHSYVELNTSTPNMLCFPETPLFKEHPSINRITTSLVSQTRISSPSSASLSLTTPHAYYQKLLILFPKSLFCSFFWNPTMAGLVYDLIIASLDN